MNGEAGAGILSGFGASRLQREIAYAQWRNAVDFLGEFGTIEMGSADCSSAFKGKPDDES